MSEASMCFPSSEGVRDVRTAQGRQRIPHGTSGLGTAKGPALANSFDPDRERRQVKPHAVSDFQVHAVQTLEDPLMEVASSFVTRVPMIQSTFLGSTEYLTLHLF